MDKRFFVNRHSYTYQNGSWGQPFFVLKELEAEPARKRDVYTHLELRGGDNYGMMGAFCGWGGKNHPFNNL